MKMKITKKKKSVKASEVFDKALVIEPSVESVETAPLDPPCSACECKYQNAIDLISAAIESLAEIAQDDEIAKDSIANLGVVMLDLKGEC